MPSRRETRRFDPRPSDTRGLGLGAELAAALIGFTLVGLWIDRYFETSPWGTLVCVFLGLVGGFYNFLRSAFRILRSPVMYGSGRASGDGSPGEKQPNAHRRVAADDAD